MNITDLETLQTMREQVWEVLKDYQLHHTDSKNVLCYEKLAKLHLQIIKQIARQNEPKQTQNKLDMFLERRNAS